MSSGEENLALARAGIANFQRGDIDAVMAELDPEIEVYSTSELANPGTYHGPEGWLKWVGDWLEAWDDFKLTLERIEAVGDRHVVTLVRQTGKGRGSGVPVEMQAAYMWDIRDQKLVRFQLHSTWEQAVDAARNGET